jgi:hypothetical protein
MLYNLIINLNVIIYRDDFGLTIAFRISVSIT